MCHQSYRPKLLQGEKSYVYCIFTGENNTLQRLWLKGRNNYISLVTLLSCPRMIQLGLKVSMPPAYFETHFGQTTLLLETRMWFNYSECQIAKISFTVYPDHLIQGLTVYDSSTWVVHVFLFVFITVIEVPVNKPVFQHRMKYSQRRSSRFTKTLFPCFIQKVSPCTAQN